MILNKKHLMITLKSKEKNNKTQKFKICKKEQGFLCAHIFRAKILYPTRNYVCKRN